MRRNLFGILLLALALIGRLMLPIAAEAHAADPLSDAPICTHDGSAPPPAYPDGFPEHRTACDAVCCHIAPFFTSPTTSIVPVDQSWTFAQWHASGSSGAPPRLIWRQWARGPPTLS